MSSREFVDTVTKDLLGSRVFVFTPRGEVKETEDHGCVALLKFSSSLVNFVLILIYFMNSTCR